MDKYLVVIRPDRIKIDVDYTNGTFEYIEEFDLPPKTCEMVTGYTVNVFKRIFPNMDIEKLGNGIKLISSKKHHMENSKVAAGLVCEFFHHLNSKERGAVLEMLQSMPIDFDMYKTNDKRLLGYMKDSIKETEEIIIELEKHFSDE